MKLISSTLFTDSFINGLIEDKNKNIHAKVLIKHNESAKYQTQL